jgi:hypothetical protein
MKDNPVTTNLLFPTTLDQRKEISTLAKSMCKGGLDSTVLKMVVARAEEDQGIFDLMKMWVEDPSMRNEITGDFLTDLGEDLYSSVFGVGYYSFLHCTKKCTDPVTLTTARTFINNWMSVIYDKGIQMSYPCVTTEGDTVKVEFEHEDRVLEVSVCSKKCTYESSWFVGRQLMMQDGVLDLRVLTLNKTLNWLLTGSVSSL